MYVHAYRIAHFHLPSFHLRNPLGLAVQALVEERESVYMSCMYIIMIYPMLFAKLQVHPNLVESVPGYGIGHT